MIAVSVIPDPGDWSDSLHSFSRISVFNSSNWLESLRKESHKPVYLDLTEEDTVVAKISGLAVGHPRTRRSTMLFYAGPALKHGDTEELIRQCYRSIYRWTKQSGYNHLVIASYDYPYDIPKCSGYFYSHRSEYIMDLTKSQEEIQKSFSSNVRRCTRRAVNAGYTITESRHEGLTDQMVDLMEKTRKTRLSKGYEEYDYFHLPHSALESLRHMVRNETITYYVAKREMEIHAITAVLQVAEGAYALYMGVSGEGYRNGIPSLLETSLIDRVKEKGFRYLNFGGIPESKTHAGLVRYKLSLGCTAHPCLQVSTANLQFPYSLGNPVHHMRDLYYRTTQSV